MLSFSSSRRIFLARSATDMRRGIDTLASMVLGELDGDPRSGDGFVFIGRIGGVSRSWSGMRVAIGSVPGGLMPAPSLCRRSTIRRRRGWSSPARMHLLLAGIGVRSARYRKRVLR